jgi:hypothetical protein
LEWAVGPVVAPANDDVATVKRVAVVAEIAALEFKFEVDALPTLRSDLALGFAVREAGLHGFDGVAEFFGDHAEEQHNALFVDRLVTEAAKIHGQAIGWPAVQRRIANFGGRRRGRRLLVGGGNTGAGECLGRAPDRVGTSSARPYGSRMNGLWCGRWKKGQDIGPFRFALRKIAKNLGKLRPGAEAAFEGAIIEFSQMTVDATGGDFVVSANSAAPIFEQFAVLEAQV